MKKKRVKRPRKAKPIHVPVEMRDRLDTIVALIQTVAGSLEDDEERASEAHVLFECVVLPLIEIRDKLEKAR